MERAGRLIGKLKLDSLTPGLDDPELRARAAWRVAAGKKIAEHTRAVALVRGSLVVEVEDQIWQRQLKTLSGFLVRNLEKALGEALVTDIDFRPMPKRMAPQRAERARGSEDVLDPVLDLLYRQSRKKG
jgi:predicted nucleic acid-binding Zn ribbon protein